MGLEGNEIYHLLYTLDFGGLDRYDDTSHRTICVRMCTNAKFTFLKKIDFEFVFPHSSPLCLIYEHLKNHSHLHDVQPWDRFGKSHLTRQRSPSAAGAKLRGPWGLSSYVCCLAFTLRFHFSPPLPSQRHQASRPRNHNGGRRARISDRRAMAQPPAAAALPRRNPHRPRYAKRNPRPQTSRMRYTQERTILLTNLSLPQAFGSTPPTSQP